MKNAIIVLYILVFALGGWVAYICYRNLQFDANNAAGIIVSALGVLVSALVGWQIYTLIDMRQYKNDFEKLRLDVAMEKQTQRNALREFAAETRLLEAGRIIGSFDEKKGNYAVVGIGYCSLIHALKNLAYQDSKIIEEVLIMMRKCIYLAKLYDAWDEMFPEEIEELSKSEYHFIISGLLGQCDYVSQIDAIKTWRQTKTMDKDVYLKTQAEFISIAANYAKRS